MSHAVPTGFESFVKVAEKVFYYEPPHIPTAPREHAAPSLIVLCAWMGALPRHISKYTNGYKRLFPNAAILVIQSGPWDCVASDGKEAPRMRVACEIIASIKKKENAGSIILHAMSNGGGIAVTRLGALFREQGEKNIFDKLIFDCLPGRYDISQLTTAVSIIALSKSKFVQLLGPILIRAWIRVVKFFCDLFGREEDLQKQRRRLNDAELFDSRVPRLYLYSKSDVLVHHQYVHEHVEEAKGLGYEVHQVVYEKAAHCALLMDRKEKYFQDIESFVGGEIGMD